MTQRFGDGCGFLLESAIGRQCRMVAMKVRVVPGLVVAMVADLQVAPSLASSLLGRQASRCCRAAPGSRSRGPSPTSSHLPPPPPTNPLLPLVTPGSSLRSLPSPSLFLPSLPLLSPPSSSPLSLPSLPWSVLEVSPPSQKLCSSVW